MDKYDAIIIGAGPAGSLSLASGLSPTPNRICGFASGYAQISPHGETYRGLKL